MSSTNAQHLPASFNRLAWSNLAAQSAEQIGLAAAPLVAVLALGAGVGETGFLQTAQTLPFLLFALPAGVLADRMSRRWLMASAEALRVASLVAVLALAVSGALTLPWLAALGFLGACGTIAFSVAAPALVPALVAPQALAAANGRIELARTMAFAGGPALAGALVGWTGGSTVFGLAAALSMGAVVLLGGLQEPPRMARVRRHPLHEVREGAAFVFRHLLLLPVFVTQVVFTIGFFILQAAYVPYAVQRLGLSAAGVGLTLATYGIGMVAGALLAPRLMRAVPLGGVIVTGPITALAAALVMVLTIWLPSGLLAGASFFLLGAGPIIWVISTTTLRQSVTPPELLGRVFAIFIAGYGARPIGAAIGALVGAHYGAERCLVVAAIVFAVQALVILTSPLLHLSRQPAMAGIAVSTERTL
ncbi:MAG TPA: MFS transporter [Methylomirabilota bacterium]|jgi:predicted MFS family arabinose efflux permease|nr:MFS transporter [Methylomirabilota bacterium]